MLLNLLWVVLGGLPMALAWWLAALICAITIVGLPWARSCWVIGCFSLWPFGSEAISRRQLRGRGDLGKGPLGALGNVIWFLVAGWWLAGGWGEPYQHRKAPSAPSMATFSVPKFSY